MLPSLSRGVRVALVLALSAGYIGLHTHDAFAKKGGGDDDSASGDDDDDDDDSKAGKQGDDDDDDDSADKDQPPATAGGLYTLQTYPQNEILRPLTITQGVTQLKAGIGTDISAKGAFGSFGISLEGEYGMTDNFMLIGGFTDAYNFKQYSIYAGFEAAIVYDLLDIRVAADLHRNAFGNLSNFCSPLISGDPSGPSFNNVAPGPVCQNSMATVVTLPDGTYGRAGTKFSIDFGMPIRYAFKPQVALVLGQKLISFDFNSTTIDHTLIDIQPVPPDVNGNPVLDNSGNPALMYTQEKVPNGIKPDLDLSGGLAFNPIPQLSILAYAELKIADFDTSANNFQVPVTLQIEGSLSHQLDLGLQFTLLNVIPPDPQSPIDQRYLTIYGQYRF
jgi:hypothetical protein